VLGDLLQSVGVIIASIIIYFFPHLKVIDPICTFIFALIVLYTTYGIVTDCIRVLMEEVPSDVKLDDIKAEISKLRDVENVHDVHIWNMSSDKKVFSCHLVSSNPAIALSRVKNLLTLKYSILHVTIQIEPSGAANPHNIHYNCENDIHD